MKKTTLPYIEHDLLEQALFNDLQPQEFNLYKDAFGALRYSSRIWLSLVMLRYRKFGEMPLVPNRNSFVQEIFLSLVQAYDSMKNAEAEKLTDTIEGKAKLTYPKRLMDWFRF